ncbi:hypothetical protein GOODEAATRI_008166, partial [Goodea atripinnis]
TIVGYKHTWMLEKRTSMNLFLEEQSFSLRKAQRTLKHKVCLYLLRLILNLVVLSLLVGAFCLIYFSGKISRRQVRS